MNTIVKMIFGSHLYGTATETSDKDFKGIFMPSERDILLGRIPKSINTSTKTTRAEGVKNTSDDVDTEIYSLHYFIKMACEGQTVALDMLHAPKNMLIEENTSIWQDIIERREMFYTKNLKAFIGYAMRQASRYGVRGSRLNNAESFLNFLKSKTPTDVLGEYWDILPKGDHIYFIEKDPNGVDQIAVCGKTFQSTSKIGYVIPILEKFYENYGERARKAANNEGVDWKACQHSLRAAFQVKQLLTEGTITFPLKEADYLKEVKRGKIPYKNFADHLESLIDEVKGLSEKSDLPEKVDYAYWDDFVFKKVKEFYNYGS